MSPHLVIEQIKEKGKRKERTTFDHVKPLCCRFSWSLHVGLIILPMNGYYYIIIAILQMKKWKVRDVSFAPSHISTELGGVPGIWSSFISLGPQRGCWARCQEMGLCCTSYHQLLLDSYLTFDSRKLWISNFVLFMWLTLRVPRIWQYPITWRNFSEDWWWHDAVSSNTISVLHWICLGKMCQF